MHDFKQHTAEAMQELIRQLKAGGYKVVHMVPNGESHHGAEVRQKCSRTRTSCRRTIRGLSSVIRTIGE